MRVLYGFLGAVFGFAVGVASLLLLNSITGRSADFRDQSVTSGILPLVFILAWPIVCAIVGAILTLRMSGKKPVWFVIGMPLAAFAMYFGSCQIGRLPSDQSMVDNFYRNRSVLEQLRQMSWPSGDNDWLSLSSDGPCETGLGQVVCHYDFSSSQIALGRELLREADVGRITKDGAVNVRLDYRSDASPSFSGGSAKKGYAFMTSPPDKIVSRLNSLNDYNDGPYLIEYRHIMGNWYIFYEYDPPVWP